MGAARVLVTTRVGGTSLPPYDAANLALHVGDDESAVRRNRARLAEQIGVRHVQFMHQVHGRDVAVVGSAVDDDVADVDALITTTPGACIAVLVADCVPVIITGERSVAVVHSGRPGVAADVVGATVDRIREHDAGPLQAFLGPAVCGRCYEVPADMRAEISALEPAAHSATWTGTPALDLPAAVRAQLQRRDITIVGPDAPCTFEDERFFSHRREGLTGRFAAVAMLVE